MGGGVSSGGPAGGFYHSLLDWHHPEFPVDGLHPRRDDEQAKAAAGKVRFAQFMHDGSEIPAEVIDPVQQAQNTTMGGLGADVLTLTLPVTRPDVAVPVIELFLERG